MTFDDPKPVDLDVQFDLVVVGTGFGSLFFLENALKRMKADARVLLLEKGTYLPHADQILQQRNSVLNIGDHYGAPEGHKPWKFTLGLGGGTLCWWGQTPRMHPSDFSLFTRYGVGRDWPVSYDDLEAYYVEAEYLIGISGDSERTGPFWRSRPYPMPAQLPSDVDAKLREIDPNQLALPNARVSISDGRRSQCCAIGNCRLCLLDSKFTALNGMTHVFEDPRVQTITGADVKVLETQGGVVTGAVFRQQEKELVARGSMFALGANGIFNPTILKRSSIDHPQLGRGINEQIGYNIEAKLSKYSGVNGGTSATGMNLRLADGDHRRKFGASMVFFDNRWKFFGLRAEFSKLQQKVLLVINSEDLPRDDNYVEVPQNWDEKPIVHHAHHSAYGEEGAQRGIDALQDILAPIGLEELSEPMRRSTEAHIQGTTVMGNDPSRSVVDRDLLHHQYRNLAVLGTSVFPTCPVANPSLTAAALSLRSADSLFG